MAGLLRRLADQDFRQRLRQAGSAPEIEEIVRAQDGDLTRGEWITCTNPAAMLRQLRDHGLITERKAQLFGAACCRRLWELLPGEARRAVEVVERHADGLASREDLREARRASRGAFAPVSGREGLARAAVLCLLTAARDDPAGHALDLLLSASGAGTGRTEEQNAQAGILRCLFGAPPFGRAAVQPTWLAFGDGVAARLARGIEDEGAFDRLPILADALLDAGCDDEELLGHLRDPGPHWRGCHAVDLVLGKE
jgi:hypothetical protein